MRDARHGKWDAQLDVHAWDEQLHVHTWDAQLGVRTWDVQFDGYARNAQLNVHAWHITKMKGRWCQCKQYDRKCLSKIIKFYSSISFSPLLHSI